MGYIQFLTLKYYFIVFYETFYCRNISWMTKMSHLQINIFNIIIKSTIRYSFADKLFQYNHQKYHQVTFGKFSTSLDPYTDFSWQWNHSRIQLWQYRLLTFEDLFDEIYWSTFNWREPTGVLLARIELFPTYNRSSKI